MKENCTMVCFQGKGGTHGCTLFLVLGCKMDNHNSTVITDSDTDRSVYILTCQQNNWLYLYCVVVNVFAMIISLLAAFADTVVVISVDCYFPSEQVWTDAIPQLVPWKGGGGIYKKYTTHKRSLQNRNYALLFGCQMADLTLTMQNCQIIHLSFHNWDWDCESQPNLQ